MDTGTRRRVERRRVTVQHATMSAAFVAAQSALGGMNGAKPVEISTRCVRSFSRARLDGTTRDSIRSRGTARAAVAGGGGARGARWARVERDARRMERVRRVEWTIENGNVRCR